LKPGLDIIGPEAIIFACEERNGGNGAVLGSRHDGNVLIMRVDELCEIGEE
jgi:hypothetical protein